MLTFSIYLSFVYLFIYNYIYLFSYLFIYLFRYIILIFLCLLSLDISFIYVVCVNWTIDGDLRMVLDGSSF